MRVNKLSFVQHVYSKARARSHASQSQNYNFSVHAQISVRHGAILLKTTTKRVCCAYKLILALASILYRRATISHIYKYLGYINCISIYTTRIILYVYMLAARRYDIIGIMMTQFNNVGDIRSALSIYVFCWVFMCVCAFSLSYLCDKPFSRAHRRSERSLWRIPAETYVFFL